MGVVYTETVVHMAPPGFEKDVPYQVAIVSLESGERVTGRIEGEVLVLEVSGAHNRELEEWTVRAKAGLLKDALGLDVRIVFPASTRLPQVPQHPPAQRQHPLRPYRL